MSRFKRTIKQTVRGLAAAAAENTENRSNVVGRANVAVARNIGGKHSQQSVSTTQTTHIRQNGSGTFEETHETSDRSAEGGGSPESGEH